MLIYTWTIVIRMNSGLAVTGTFALVVCWWAFRSSYPHLEKHASIHFRYFQFPGPCDNYNQFPFSTPPCERCLMGLQMISFIAFLLPVDPNMNGKEAWWYSDDVKKKASTELTFLFWNNCFLFLFHTLPERPWRSKLQVSDHGRGEDTLDGPCWTKF